MIYEVMNTANIGGVYENMSSRIAGLSQGLRRELRNRCPDLSKCVEISMKFLEKF